MRKHLRILVLPTQLRFFLKISRIGFPGNPVKIFISRDSASFTESETVFEPEKSPQEKGSSEFSLSLIDFEKPQYQEY